MSTKFPVKVPPHVPAAGVAEMLKHLPIVLRSDPVNYNGDTSVNLFELEGGELILDIHVKVNTAFEASGTSAAATGTITVPGDTGAITVFDAGGTLLQIATTAGLAPDTVGAIDVPDSGGFVTALIAPGSTTAGQFEVYMTYLPKAGLL